MSSEEEDEYSREYGKKKGGKGDEEEAEEEGESEDDLEPCQPPEDEKEMLFLIEFLVDALLLKPENMGLENMDPCLLQGQTCITLTFLHFPPMKICELDIDRCRQTGGNFIKFNSGKSLMFALSESQFENPPPISLDVVVFKMLPHGSVPKHFTVGATKIGLTELFKQVFDKVFEKPDKLPLSKSIKDNYSLIGKKKNCPTGEITIYIRLSCLGQNVVTEFQRGVEGCDPFLFKSKESRKVYECKPKETTGLEEAEDLCPPLPGWGALGDKDCGDNQMVTKARSMGGMGWSDGGGYGGGVRRASAHGGAVHRGSAHGGGGHRESAHGGVHGGSAHGGSVHGGGTHGGGNEMVNQAMVDDGEYEEFGTEIQGHALSIKIQKSERRRMAPPVVPSKARSMVSTTRFRADGNQVNFQVPQNQNICSKGKDRNKARVYNIESSPSQQGGGLCDDESSQGLESLSANNDIFVLKIGKKGDPNGQARLELELKTPKLKIDRPIDKPRVWDKMVQTEKEEQQKKAKKKKKK